MLPADSHQVKGRLQIMVVSYGLICVVLLGMGGATMFLASPPVWEHPGGRVWVAACYAAAALALFGLAVAGVWARVKPQPGPVRVGWCWFA